MLSDLLPDDLVAEARAQAGLDDFGGDSFREGLEIFCASVNAEAQLNELGETAIHGNIVGNLVNRLRVVDWSREHPEVADERIDAPLIVIGMFRAGTTFLSYLLEHDPRNRALLRWESGDSVPLPHGESSVPNFTTCGAAVVAGPALPAVVVDGVAVPWLTPHAAATRPITIDTVAQRAREFVDCFRDNMRPPGHGDLGPI